jgi:hypothetical protein
MIATHNRTRAAPPLRVTALPEVLSIRDWELLDEAFTFDEHESTLTDARLAAHPDLRQLHQGAAAVSRLMQEHTEAMTTGTAPPATVATWNTLFFLRSKLDRRAERLARVIRWGSQDADFRAGEEAEAERAAELQAELDHEWADREADAAFWRGPR